jgi:hypothetical protein
MDNLALHAIEPTPLQPRQFFRGTWTGDGELVTHILLRWFAPNEHLHMTSKAHWLSDTEWLVTDHFEFSSGKVIDRKMLSELIAPDRVHVTADDMPMGADILLSESGFHFTPYPIVVRYRGFRIRLRCLDENTIDRDGFIHDRVRMFFFGFPVATLRLGPISRRDSQFER